MDIGVQNVSLEINIFKKETVWVFRARPGSPGGEQVGRRCKRIGQELELKAPWEARYWKAEGRYSAGTPKAEGALWKFSQLCSSCTQNVQMEEKAGTDSSQVSYAKVTSMENLPEYQGTLLPAHCLLHICFYLLSVSLTGRYDGCRSLVPAAESLAPKGCWASPR